MHLPIALDMRTLRRTAVIHGPRATGSGSYRSMPSSTCSDDRLLATQSVACTRAILLAVKLNQASNKNKRLVAMRILLAGSSVHWAPFLDATRAAPVAEVLTYSIA